VNPNALKSSKSFYAEFRRETERRSSKDGRVIEGQRWITSDRADPAVRHLVQPNGDDVPAVHVNSISRTGSLLPLV
jgi:hypothetical protein